MWNIDATLENIASGFRVEIVSDTRISTSATSRSSAAPVKSRGPGMQSSDASIEISSVSWRLGNKLVLHLT